MIEKASDMLCHVLVKSSFFRLSREVGKNTAVGGIQLSKGDNIMIPVRAIHYDPDVYPEPDDFRPER